MKSVSYMFQSISKVIDSANGDDNLRVDLIQTPDNYTVTTYKLDEKGEWQPIEKSDHNEEGAAREKFEQIKSEF